MPNPFFYGDPVPMDLFLDRWRELRRIAGRIINRGQSTAIVGEPRSGKTSLLLYLGSPEARAQFYGAQGGRLLFSYLDAQTLGGRFSQAQFWEYALRPLHEQVIASDPDSPLARAYGTCQENEFGAFVLERLFAQMVPTGWRLVLMLDEFDVLLYHPILNCAEFFGSLRSLASRSQGALALVVASRRSLASLNRATQEFSRTGSPYFNFLYEITLGPLPYRAIAALLRRAEGRFTLDDCRFIRHIAGGHPYLLQVAAAEQWEAYSEGEDDPNRRWRQVGQRLYEEAGLTLGDTWQFWPPAVRCAFTTVALDHTSFLLGLHTKSPVSKEDASTHTDLIKLFEILDKRFGEDDLQTLCFYLNVDYENLPAGGRANKARELISFLRRRSRIADLLETGRKLRPDVAWEDTLEVDKNTNTRFPSILPERSLVRDFDPELRLLDKQGYVAEDTTVPGGWRVRPQALLWWIADELVRTTRDEIALAEWLHRQEMESLLTQGGEEQWTEAVRAVCGVLRDGVETLIEAAARGAAEALARGV